MYTDEHRYSNVFFGHLCFSGTSINLISGVIGIVRSSL